MAKKSALQKIEDHEKLCRIMQRQTFDQIKELKAQIVRIDRIGQTKPMTYIDIICEDTVDERIVKALRKKVNIASQVMGEELKAWI